MFKAGAAPDSRRALQQETWHTHLADEEQEKELRRVLEIQRGLLPKELPQLKGMELAMNRRVMEEVAGFCHRHFRDDVTVVALAIR